MPDERDGCSHVPPRFRNRFRADWDVSPGTFAETIGQAIDRLVAGELDSLLLTGPVGCGKSLAGAIAANETAAVVLAPLADLSQSLSWDEFYAQMEAIELRCPAWLSVPPVLAALRRGMTTGDQSTPELVEEATRAPGLLVLDDVGTRITEWSSTVVEDLLTVRYDHRLPTFVTSNLSAGELADAGLSRLVSRLADGGALVQVDDAPDYRFSRRQHVEPPRRAPRRRSRVLGAVG